MRIIIAGAGDLGFHLARLLAYEEQDIILIDQDNAVLEHASNHLDVHTIRGSSTSISILEEANVSKADLLIAVTSIEETNLTTAIIGKALGAKRTVARISNIEFLHQREKLDLKTIGIDEIISPESLAAKEIKRLLKQSALTDTFEFEKGMLSLIGITVDEKSELLDKTLTETAYLNPDHNFTTVAILRENQTIIPHGENKFQINDHAYFITEPSGTDRVMALAGKEQIEIKNIMILGGSKVGINTAKQLSKKYNIKLIEQDKEKCFNLADELPDTMIINGDGRDIDLLKEEGIDRMDAVIAVTGNSETNIISCLVAKNNGVAKTIAAVENMDYIHLSQNIGVDTLINKKLIAANFIFRYIRKGQVINLTSIHGVDAEILEFEVQPNSKILEHELRNIDFPKTAIIGGVIRKGIGHTVRGSFHFQPKDRVVVLSRSECIHTVEGFFK
ncbi:Trk system potassium transporter TrkA [Marinoscillum sp. 108]|jgi:trk system potassium uptake protein TrkA|uniref:Trk system potassium uptake protein TrkA n=1 Tax=Marinoscillum luteum TaxID=861051 RepID=A0ABW7N6U7_9BACT|nr:Trk system potassium transporter TrkA [Marinoscillum sp. 108]VXD17725.1 Trk system potassium uptake protein TrkA [Marinoscillum sp. 108]